MEDTPATARKYIEALGAPEHEGVQSDVIPLVAHVEATVSKAPSAAKDLVALSNEPFALHFSHGARARSTIRALTRAFNARDFKRVVQLLNKKGHELSPFQRDTLNWLLADLGGSPSEPFWRQKAKRQAASATERAAFYENRAFLSLRRGEWEHAKKICEQGIALSPTAEGLWINLLVAMDRLGEDAAIEQVLLRLPSLFDVEEGLLGLYLLNDPAFRTALCNGG